MSPELAGIYGVPAPSKEMERIPFPKGSERSGLLGQGLFLALTAKPDETSPTARGLFVREQFLCQHVPDPPPGVNTNLARGDRGESADESRPHDRACDESDLRRVPQAGGPDRVRFREVRCGGGRGRDKLVLEFRTASTKGKNGAVKTIGLDFNTNGNVAGLPDSQFSSPADMGTILAKSPQCQECIVKQYYRYSAGRVEGPAERPAIQKALERFQASQFQFKELMLAITAMKESRMSQVIVNRVRTSRRTLLKGMTLAGARISLGFAASGVDVQFHRHGLCRGNYAKAY